MKTVCGQLKFLREKEKMERDEKLRKELSIFGEREVYQSLARMEGLFQRETVAVKSK